MASPAALRALAAIEELTWDLCGWRAKGRGWRERSTDEYTPLLPIVPSDHLKLRAWGKAKKHILEKGVDFSERTFSFLLGPARQQSRALPAAKEEDSVAMRRKLNFIIALPYLMSVSQAAGDVLMKLELYSL